MNIRRKLTAVITALALAIGTAPFIQIEKAAAAATVMCAPNPVEGANNRTIGSGLTGTGTVSPIPSGTTYVLNGQGCTVVQQADIGYFLSQGFSAGPPFGQNILFTTGVWTGTTSFQIGTLPASTYIQHIIFSNSTANAVTGNISVGTTSGGTDVVASQACGANCLVFVSDATLLKRIFSTTAAQPIFVSPITAGNNANVTVTVVYGYF